MVNNARESIALPEEHTHMTHIDWPAHTVGTSKDPERAYQRQAVSELNAAANAKAGYDRLLREAIATYGNRHYPVKVAGRVISPCAICVARGITHTNEEMLNHQTGAIIAGVYADHFPFETKRALRTHLSSMHLHNHNAAVLWRKAGRQMSTFRRLQELSW